MPRLRFRVSLFLFLATTLTKRLAAFAVLPCLLMISVDGAAQTTGLPPFNGIFQCVWR